MVVNATSQNKEAAKKKKKKQDNLAIIRLLVDGRSQADNRLRALAYMVLMAADCLHASFFFWL